MGAVDLQERLHFYKAGDVNQSRKNALVQCFNNVDLWCARYKSSRQDKERELIVSLRPISTRSIQTSRVT